MRTSLLIPFVLVAAAGCQRDRESPGAADAGPGNYARIGPVGLSVESVTLGKVRMRGMTGQDGESKDDVFTLRTRFKLLDTGTPVKQPALQRDGGLIAVGDGGLKLLDQHNRRYNAVVGGGFNGIRGRRADAVVLTADSPEVTDLLTFESVASAAGDLTLEVPANYQLQQPDGTFRLPQDPGTFRIRIPHALWSAPPPATDAGPGRWVTVGPVSVCVESVRLGKVPVKTFGAGGGTGTSAEDVLAVAVRVRLADPSARVKKPPFVADGPAARFAGSAVALRSVGGGDPYKTVTAFGLSEIVGRQTKDAELSGTRLEVTDLLTFEARAADAHELILTLYPQWQERKPDGTWADTAADGEFRFRIPRTLWAK